MHQWVALVDNSQRSKRAQDIAGYLRVSIQVTGKHDKAISITEGKAIDLEEKQMDSILIPVQVQPKYMEVILRFFCGHKLPEMDTGSFFQYKKNTMDGYVKLKMRGRELKTKVVKMKQDKILVWDQQFIVPIQLPILRDLLTLEVWDDNKDVGVADTIIGSIPIRINRIIAGAYSQPFWQNIYGSPVNNDNEETLQMN